MWSNDRRKTWQAMHSGRRAWLNASSMIHMLLPQKKPAQAATSLDMRGRSPHIHTNLTTIQLALRLLSQPWLRAAGPHQHAQRWDWQAHAPTQGRPGSSTPTCGAALPTQAEFIRMTPHNVSSYCPPAQEPFVCHAPAGVLCLPASAAQHAGLVALLSDTTYTARTARTAGCCLLGPPTRADGALSPCSRES